MLTNTKFAVPVTSWTGTAALGQSTGLVDGTVVCIVAPDMNQTTALARLGNFIQIIASPPVFLRIQPASAPSIRRRRRIRTKLVNLHNLIAAIPKVAISTQEDRVVVFEKVKKLGGVMSAGQVRLIGKKGSAQRPTRRSYDLDLDEYQS